MEPKIKLISKTRLYNLSNSDELQDYAKELQKIDNNPHKYSVGPEREIKTDGFGYPYTIFQYFDNINEIEKEHHYDRVSYFSEVINLALEPDAIHFDEIYNSSLENKLDLLWYGDYSEKQPQTSIVRHYRLIIYRTPINGFEFNANKEPKKIKPVGGN